MKLRWLRRLGGLALATLVTVCLFELGLRASGVSYPTFYTADFYCGSTLRPGAGGWFTREGHAYVRINSNGLRGPEQPVRKPDGVLRIAVLGDSYTMAPQVAEDKTFIAVLEKHVQSCPTVAGRRVEALNFGVSGYGTAQELLMFRHKARHFQPDMVLLAFFTGNDIRNNHRGLDQTPTRPHFVLDAAGRLVEDMSFRADAGFQRRLTRSWRAFIELSDSSRIIQVTMQAFRNFKAMRNLRAPAHAARAPGGASDDGTQDEIGLDAEVYREPTDPVWQEAWRITEALLTRTYEEVRASGATFLLAVLTNGVQVDPDSERRRALTAALDVANLTYPDTRVRDFADGKGIPVLTLVQPLSDWVQSHGECLHGFPADPCRGHWNPTGHRLAGELIGARVCELLNHAATKDAAL